MKETKIVPKKKKGAPRQGGKRRLALEIIASAMKDLRSSQRGKFPDYYRRSARRFFNPPTPLHCETLQHWMDTAGIDKDALMERVEKLKNILTL